MNEFDYGDDSYLCACVLGPAAFEKGKVIQLKIKRGTFCKHQHHIRENWQKGQGICKTYQKGQGACLTKTPGCREHRCK